MIYLDYSANFPVSEAALKALWETEAFFYGNCVSIHKEGKRSLSFYEKKNSELLSLFSLDPKEYEAIYTSSASESNNLAIKGVFQSYQGFGKHILVSEFEHSSVNATLGYLKEGFSAEVGFVKTGKDGRMDLDDLKKKLREDTILLCLSLVEGETGSIQDYRSVIDILKDYPNCHLLLDATQAVGKIPVSFDDADMVSFTPHKYGGIIGTGVLLKKRSIVLTPLIHGGNSVSIYRSSTAPLGLIASTVKATEEAITNLESHYQKVRMLQKKLVSELKNEPDILINSNLEFPYILNISVKNRKASEIVLLLSDMDVCVSQKSACSIPNTPSKTIMSIYHDRERAMGSFRISLSYLTTEEEIDEFVTILRGIIHGRS